MTTDHEQTQSSSHAPKPPQRGWECPKCGSVYAPWFPKCGKCGPPQTYTGWTPPISPVPERFRSTSAPRFNGG